MTHVYHLDVDLLGGLQTLSAQAGPHFIEISVGDGSQQQACTLETSELRTRLLAEARSFLAIENEVALRKATSYESENAEDEETGSTAFAVDVAARARQEAALYESRMAGLETVADDVLRVFQIIPAAAEGAREAGIYVRLHWDGYAMENTRELQLAARREHLGLPAGADWSPAR